MRQLAVVTKMIGSEMQRHYTVYSQSSVPTFLANNLTLSVSLSEHVPQFGVIMAERSQLLHFPYA
jgi:hypothetical protein